jgi:hypothetical protein
MTGNWQTGRRVFDPKTMVPMNGEERMISYGEAGLCKDCKIELAMDYGGVCSLCHSTFMSWFFRGHHYEIREFRNAGKGG